MKSCNIASKNFRKSSHATSAAEVAMHELNFRSFLVCTTTIITVHE